MQEISGHCAGQREAVLEDTGVCPVSALVLGNWLFEAHVGHFPQASGRSVRFGRMQTQGRGRAPDSFNLAHVALTSAYIRLAGLQSPQQPKGVSESPK